MQHGFTKHSLIKTPCMQCDKRGVPLKKAPHDKAFVGLFFDFGTMALEFSKTRHVMFQRELVQSYMTGKRAGTDRTRISCTIEAENDMNRRKYQYGEENSASRSHQYD